jgi:hypothetical protein
MEFEYCDEEVMDEVVLHDSAEDQFELNEGNDYEDRYMFYFFIN